MEQSRKPLVVVLSRSYSNGLCVVRALADAGYTVDVIASANREGASAMLGASRYIRRYEEVVSERIRSDADDLLLQALLQYESAEEAEIVLLPTDDYTAAMVDLNRDALSRRFRMPEIVGGAPGDLKHHMDKSVQSGFARKAGILTPREWVISLRETPIRIPDDMQYPCYCKPLESSQGYKREMAKCEDPEALSAHLEKLRERFAERSILVQEFLAIDEEIDLEGVCLDQEVILPAIVWKRIIAQYDKGVPLAGKTYPVDVLGPVRDQVVAMLKAFHYVGMFDLGLNIVGKSVYFNELNLRSGGTNYVYFKSGVNLPDLFVKGVLGQPIAPDETQVRAYGKTYFYEKVAWADYLHDLLPREELVHSQETADIPFIHCEEDPEPEVIFDRAMQERLQKKEEQARRARIRQQREERIHLIMDETGWDREQVQARYAAAREKLGVSLRDYTKNRYWELSEEEMAAAYEKLLARRERIRQQKESCVTSAMAQTGWDREEAERRIEEARKKWGITYREYETYGFCLLSPERQEKRQRKVLRDREKQKKRKKS